MKIRYIISCLLLLFISFASCTDDESSLETKGYLELGVSKNVEVITRAFDVEDQSLYVDICAGSNDSIVKHFSDYNDMAGERVLLDVGTYKVKVSSNPYSKLEFEQPTFYGEKTNVAVTAGKTTPVSVECFLSCVKVTTEFTKPVKEAFESVVARVSDKSGLYLDYNLNETRVGYFQPGYILVDLTLTNKEGYEFKMSKLVDNTEARDHYHLVFDLIDSGDNNSGMDFDISIETDPTNDEKHTVTVPLPETGYEQDPPVVVVKENGEIGDGIISLDKGDGQSLLLEASSYNIGLNAIMMDSKSTYFDEKEIPVSLDLMNLTAENNEKLSDIGLSFELSEEKTSFKLDFSKLIPQLSGGMHSFVFSARDNMGHESVQEIKINVNLSIMTKNVLAEDIWAHYVTLRGYVKNATEEDKGSYKFQYKEKDDTSWMDVEGSVTVLTSLANDGANITQIITGLQPGKEYEYRLVEENQAAEGVVFTTGTAEALLGGNFENSDIGPWIVTDGGANPGAFWSSGNNSFANELAVQKVDNGSNVACLKSVFANVMGLGKFAAGNAFTGSFDKSGTNGTVTLGKGFTSRPYSLKGQYKYTPSKVNYGGGKIADGSLDQCAIYIVLLTETIALNTADESTLDWKNKYKDRIVALAELPTETDMKTDGYENFELKLDYLKKDVMPSYIGILCTSSKYGDYFQGGTNSELCIDNFELIYSLAPDVNE